MARISDTEVRLTTPGAAKSGRGGDFIKKLTRRITAADLTDGDTSQTFVVGTLPAEAVLLGISRKVHTLISGGTIDGATLDVGINGGNVDAYIDGADVFTGGSTGMVREDVTSPGDGVTHSSLPAGNAADVQVDATITTSTGDVAEATAGDIEVILSYFHEGDPDA